MELEKQIDGLKVSLKILTVSFLLMIPMILFDAWMLQIVWDKWAWGLTGVSLTYVGYVGVMMLMKVVSCIFADTRINRVAVKNVRDVIVESFGKRLAMLTMFGLFSLIWMILI